MAEICIKNPQVSYAIELSLNHDVLDIQEGREEEVTLTPYDPMRDLTVNPHDQGLHPSATDVVKLIVEHVRVGGREVTVVA